MKTKSLMKNNLFRLALGTAALLMIPLLLRWPWTLSDFVIMGVLIFGTGLTYELITSKLGKKHRVIVAIALLIAFLLVWAELAVGLFGTPFAGN